MFDHSEQRETEVLRTWWHIPVHDLRVDSSANGSSVHTTHFACSGTTVHSWGLTCWKVYPSAMSCVVIRIYQGAFDTSFVIEIWQET